MTVKMTQHFITDTVETIIEEFGVTRAGFANMIKHVDESPLSGGDFVTFDSSMFAESQGLKLFRSAVNFIVPEGDREDEWGDYGSSIRNGACDHSPLHTHEDAHIVLSDAIKQTGIVQEIVEEPKLLEKAIIAIGKDTSLVFTLSFITELIAECDQAQEYDRLVDLLAVSVPNVVPERADCVRFLLVILSRRFSLISRTKARELLIKSVATVVADTSISEILERVDPNLLCLQRWMASEGTSKFLLSRDDTAKVAC